jgi:type III pantothenate kinase
MKALLLDVGNTRIKWGVLDSGEIRRTGHISQARIGEKGLQVLTTKLPRRVDEVFASNVAGASFATRLSGVVGMHCDCDVRFARSEKYGWGLRNSYTQPRRMGVDRWVAMVGAWAEVQDACLVVDVGTAVTLDAIDETGTHLGGQIIPGVGAMATALSAATSDIPSVRPLPAREGSQGNGIEPETVLTGGDASRILDGLSVTPLHRPHLVLLGLAHMLENAQ